MKSQWHVTTYAAPLGSKPDSTEQKSCAQRGGKFERVGMLQSWACVIPYRDGGHVCSDDSQCAGGCIFDFGGNGPIPKKGDRVSGICIRTNQEFGCIAHVKNGRLLDTLCID
jgi:hypothetical protein